MTPINLNSIPRFTSLARAEQARVTWQTNTRRAHYVVLGEVSRDGNSYFVWVADARQARALRAAGYEVVKG